MYISVIIREIKPDEESEKLNIERADLNYVTTSTKPIKAINGKRESTIRTKGMLIKDLEEVEEIIKEKYKIPDKRSSLFR